MYVRTDFIEKNVYNNNVACSYYNVNITIVDKSTLTLFFFQNIMTSDSTKVYCISML